MESLQPTNHKKRFLALDVFRGATICMMILVNTPGTGADMYPFLVHADWSGFTLADLVFPSFLFAMGNAMSFSLNKSSVSNKEYFAKVLKRSSIIFLLGFLMYWFPFFHKVNGEWALYPFEETRVMGVLQRIAICYFFVALLIRFLKNKHLIILSIAVLFVYWLVLLFFAGTADFMDMATNAATQFDKWIIGDNHMYKRDALIFDPEGLLSTLPSLVNVIIGYLVGVFVQQKGSSYEGIAKLFLLGFLLIIAALAWDLFFPINKKLWTSSFVLYTCGIDSVLMAMLLYFIEIKKQQKGVYFFQVFGKNPLFIYLFSELFYVILRRISVGDKDAFEFFSEAIIQQIFPGSFGAFLVAVLFMLLCWSIGWILDKRKIYIKI
ncbi:Predicted acyltransferase [Pustulibacterium marinum]|uniref:Predicted acyltransferase n=1 Tax=Pustulibacterium marinum TaxID=1224947 RepID=A0A1I7IAB4_9FLAO|nr:DUF5009 domain-containing protein [Pustulibacterium marinum]SFU69905.1 Predicted acyltransferase [Pustulibacterium marinum]